MGLKSNMTPAEKKIAIFGVTGSVGRSTADVVLSQGGMFDVEVVTASSNVAELAKLAKKLHAKKAVIANENAYHDLKEALSGTNIGAEAGTQALLEAASIPVDWTMCAIVGVAGLPCLLKSLEQGGCVAIANKEPLVSAGPIVMETARKYGTTILPVDSEHNAVFQVFDKDRSETVENIILTASGGPFRTWTKEEMAAATPEQAVAHPNWSMGAKISVDSATMMNKALEVIEAHYLFNMDSDKIQVLVHPQSIIHSMVEYIDGSVLAQLGAPDMKTPIAHTFAFPDRMETPGQKLDWRAMKSLTFEQVDHDRFPSIGKAYQCLEAGLYASVIMNAANEELVAAFLQKRISFPAIVDNISRILDDFAKTDISTLDEVINLDHSVRGIIKSYIN